MQPRVVPNPIDVIFPMLGNAYYKGTQVVYGNVREPIVMGEWPLQGITRFRWPLKTRMPWHFAHQKGIFCYKVMPFSLKNAGATYQRAMKTIFEDMLHKMV